MSLAGFIQGMGSPIDTASRQADMFTKLQGLSDAQVRAEQLRLQRMRNEQYQQELMRPVEGPEALPGGAPAPMVRPAAPAAAPTPTAAPTFIGGIGATEANRTDAMRNNSRASGRAAAQQRMAAGELQRLSDTANIAALPAAAADVVALPFTGGYNVLGNAAVGAGNLIRRGANVVAGEAKFAPIPAFENTSITPVYDALVRSPEQRLAQMRAAQAGAQRPVPPATGEAPDLTQPAATPAATPDFNRLAEAVKMVESGGDPTAVSPKGALGTMQTMPGTLRDPGFGVRPAQNDSDAERERVGRDYLQAMIAKYPGRLDYALAAYNWGPGNVDNWIAAGADPAKLPKETREYIPKVMARLGGQPNMAASEAERQAAFGGAPTTTAAAPAAPAMQFSPEQVTRVSTAVQQDLRVKQLQLTEINRLLALAPDVQTAQNLRNQANEIRFGAYQAQLVNASAQALGGDENAVAQLANAARVQYAQTDQGYVPVQMGPDGQFRATGQPMTRERFINALFSEATGAAQKAREAQAAAMAKAQGEIAVERVKGQNKVYETQAAAERDLQKLIVERQMARDDVKGVEFDPIHGTMFVRTATGVSMMVPGEDLGGGIMSEPRLVRVQ